MLRGIERTTGVKHSNGTVRHVALAPQILLPDLLCLLFDRILLEVGLASGSGSLPCLVGFAEHPDLDWVTPSSRRPPDAISCSDKVEACCNNPEVGYTEDYETELISGDDLDVIDSDFTVDCSLCLGK